jgi:membrane associated rhomboid family serine protease
MSFNSYGNRFPGTTAVVLNLLIINALVFFAQLVFDGPDEIVTRFLALWPLKSGIFEPYQLVTHMFAHGGWGHIFFNMFALWSFGTMLERVWGPKKFLFFYFVCGLAAGAAQLFFSQDPAIGASGAIMGLLAAFAYLFPNTELIIFPFPFPVKAKYAIAVFAAIDLFGGVYSTGSNIAHFAHLGGLLMGFILVIIWNKSNKKTFY